MGVSSTPTETTPLVELRTWHSTLRVVALGTLMIGFSVGLINFNKWLMHTDRFPYAVPLVLFHMIFCSSLAYVLKTIHPALFPALTDPDKAVDVDATFIFKGLLPIAVFFTASLVLTNMAYTRLSVAFLQMIKQSNLIWAYAFSVFAALETFSWQHVKLIVLGLFAVGLTIKGELHFAMAGFCIQFTAIILESIRIILQALILSGKKLDPLSYVLLISPLSGAILTILLAFITFLPPSMIGQGLEVPSIATFIEWLPILAANAMVAFCLNVCIAFVIKETSAMSYVMYQLIKDITVVTIGALLLSEAITNMQVLGFSLQIGVALVWSLLKNFPSEFSNGITIGLWTLYRGRAEKDMGGKSVKGFSTPLSPIPENVARLGGRPSVEQAREAGV